MTTRWSRYLVAVAIAFAMAGSLVVVRQSSIARRSADFTIVYSAALLIRDGKPESVYQADRLGPLMLRLSDKAIDPRLPFDAPFLVALPFIPLTLLPLEAAFHVWQVVTLLLLGLSIVLLSLWFPLGRNAAAIGALTLAGFPATWALLSEGQSSALLLLGAVLLLAAWSRGSWRLAAAGALLLALKPHYLPAYLILLAAARQWRPLCAAVAAAVVVGLSPMLAGGPAGLYAMVWSALDAGQGVVRYNESLIGTLAPLLPGRLPTIVGFGLWAVALAGVALIAARLPKTPPVAALATAIAIGLAPHALPYDTVLLAVPAWLGFVLHRSQAIGSPAPAVLALALALVVDLGRPLVNLAPLVLLAILGWYARDLWLRRQQGSMIGQAA